MLEADFVHSTQSHRSLDQSQFWDTNPQSFRANALEVWWGGHARTNIVSTFLGWEKPAPAGDTAEPHPAPAPAPPAPQ